MEIPWASTIKDVNPLSINMYLYWESLKYAIAQGCTTFDFGRSTVDSGTYRFKKQWGAQPQQLYWHYWLGSKREMPKLNPSNPKYKQFIRLWKKLPLVIANRLGPMIVRNLP
jgi:lipid II:glycine glycyltransferase (peptidoglycan interpeptide bridge formation enzyme)